MCTHGDCGYDGKERGYRYHLTPLCASMFLYVIGGKAELTVTVLVVKGEAGANFIGASAKSKLKPSGINAIAYADRDENGEISFSGKVDFTGLTVYYMCFTRLKLVNDSKTSKEVKPGSKGNKTIPLDAKQTTELVKSELKKKQEILAACNLFDAMGIKPVKSESEIEQCFL